MKEFKYVIKDQLGIHARPAGTLIKEAKKYQSKILINKGERAVEATKLMAIMSMGIKCGDEIMVIVEGADEEIACAEIRRFFEENL